MQRATAMPARKTAYYDQFHPPPKKRLINTRMFQSEPVQNRVYKSLKVWSLYADLEESFGTFKVRSLDDLTSHSPLTSVSRLPSPSTTASLTSGSPLPRSSSTTPASCGRTTTLRRPSR
ncbi:hypothetical protein LAZ67_17001235 [Cordylochernes scorpioides]|uniref:Pre-mRNA-splicing factor Syf1/CRNKL1-like C-terminal HAT-repeats domain-containing protein n=1 Tax=Cordylochernes scorpioides TaxID=51811 RepID=A0ABY6LEL3_9ARAC|nr:hypothetical protein LAZ67_17001235 [Cordylochernes scorpioides]